MAIDTSTFRIGGLVSGLSTDQIVTELLDIERRPIQILESKKLDVTNRLSAWRSFNTRAQALSVQTARLRRPDTFTAGTASSSNNDLVTASASSGVAKGTFQIKVKSLAQAHQTASQTYSSTTANVGTGTVSIKMGSAIYENIVIDETNNTLEGLRNAINNSRNNVTASILNIGGETPSYKLILTSNIEGESGEIDITMNLSGGSKPVFTEIQEAQNAHIVLGSGENAIDVYRSSNRISDVISGVTLNLKGVSGDNPIIITTETNTAAIVTNIQNFIEQFNNIIDYFNDQFFYDESTGRTGTLFNDTSLYNVKENLYNKVLDMVSNDGNISSLSQMGIGLDKAGKLRVEDSGMLNRAIESNLRDVSAFFTSGTDSLGVRLDNYLSDILDPSVGLIRSRENLLSEDIESIKSQIEVKEEYMKRIETRHYRTFSNLEAAMTKIQSQSNYLDYQISSMSKPNNDW